MVNILNRVMFENVQSRMNIKHYITFVILKYLGDGVFQHAGAHLNIIVYRSRTDSCEKINTSGSWLNVIENLEEITENHEFKLESHDLLFLYTDGLTEARDKNHEEFGIKRIKEHLHQHKNDPVKEIIDRILISVTDFIEDKIEDDITLLIARKK